MLRTYYILTKPGIIYGNLISTLAGFFLASQLHIELLVLVSVVVGTALIIAAACVSNNVLDREIDRHMKRTKRRALVQGSVTVPRALAYASVLGVLGVIVLALGTNLLTVAVGVAGFVVYVWVYGVSKRRSEHSTLIGSLAGATPPVAGYTAVTGHIDGAALALFAILTVWQMPHFYAIAMYRHQEYAKARLPILSVKKGMRVTKQQIVSYLGIYVVVVQLPVLLGYTGFTYAAVVGGISVWWLWLGIAGLCASDDVVWARRLFLRSLVVLLVTSFMLAIGALLP